MEQLFRKNGEMTYRWSEAAGKNCFLTKSPKSIDLPTYEDAKTILPEPLWEGHEDELSLYRRAWEIAFSNLQNPTEESGFVSPFIDTAFNGFLFMWDSAFIMMFGKYGRRAFDFQGTMDNFYSNQHYDGFICREICEKEPGGHFARHDPASTGPALMAWCEWESYLVTGDLNRVRDVFDPLLAYHRWLRENHTWRDGLYWSSGWGCGMDNQPRVEEGYSSMFSHGHMVWADACMQAVLDCRVLSSMAKLIGREEVLTELDSEAEYLTERINSLLWNEDDGFYYDLWKNGRQNGVKSIGAYWSLLSGVASAEQTARLAEHLENPREFKRKHPIPTLSADHPEYTETGNYWKGGVWAPTNYMVLRGLESRGYHSLAHDIAKAHLDSVTEVYRETGTLWENYQPDSDAPGIPAKRDFVGWTGLVPISVMFEFVFGLKPDPEANKITWHVSLTDRHGIMRYPFKDGTVDLICESRDSENEMPMITVRSDSPVTVEVIWQGGEFSVISSH